MLEILYSWLSPIRAICIWIDGIAFSLIDNCYDLIVTFSSGSLFSSDTIKTVMRNMYFVIGLISLFKIAMVFINSIINPDRLTDKEKGISNVLGNFVVMIVLLIATPIIFDTAMDVQKKVVEGHYIESLFINTDSLTKKKPGKAMRSLVISSLITVDEDARGSAQCGSTCQKAIDAYDAMDANKSFSMPTLYHYIGTSIKDDDGNVLYVYNYKILVTLAAALFIVYVLLSFGIDIAVRMVELSVLEILAPLFIATYIDPKSAKSGAFHKWLTTVGKTYASLFIKLAIVALMLLFISLLTNVSLNSDVELGWFEKLILLLAILIFAKKAPKMIGDMVGVEGGIGEGLGIGKKLGGAALVGGALSKGIDSAKKFAGQKAKNFGANRLRNTAARIGGAKEAHNANKLAKKNNTLTKGNKQSLWRQSRAAAKNSRQANWGQNAQGFFKDIGAGYMGGRKNLNPDATSLSDTIKAKAEVKATAYNNKIGNTPSAIQERQKEAAQRKTASQMRIGDIQELNGKRDKKASWQGYDEFKTAIGGDVMSEKEAYIKDAINNGYELENGQLKKNGNIISVDDYKNTFTEAGQKDISAFVAKNVQESNQELNSNIQMMNQNNEKIANFNSQIAQLASQNNMDYGAQMNNEINDASKVINDPASSDEQKNEAQKAINVYSKDKDYLAYKAKESVQYQINSLETENTQLEGNISTVITNMQTAEKNQTADPSKVVGAVQVGNDYVTQTGVFTKDSNGYTYKEEMDASNPNTYRIDPVHGSAINSKIEEIVSKTDAKASEAHKAMEPKTS